MKPSLDPHAPEFRLATTNLLEIKDCLGLMDYATLSCTGKPYGEVDQIEHGGIIMIPKQYPAPELMPIWKETPEPNQHSSASSEANSDSSQEWLDIPVKELLATNPRCGWSRRKTKLCKRFLTSFCARNDCCPFIHAKPMIVHRDQIIFLGGLPSDCTRASLFKELIDAGLQVVNYPIVLDRFTPRVVLKTRELANELIRKKTIQLFGKEIDVRAYKQSSEVFQIFLGGLPSHTNNEDLRRALAAESCDLVNVPTINKGYVINCEVANKKQQERLITKGYIEVCGQRTQVKRLTKRRRSRSPRDRK